jgi:hypothetical protein
VWSFFKLVYNLKKKSTWIEESESNYTTLKNYFEYISSNPTNEYVLNENITQVISMNCDVKSEFKDRQEYNICSLCHASGLTGQLVWQIFVRR